MKTLKSFLITLLCCAAIAYIGAFFEIWKLPRHDNMFTARDFARKIKPFFGFNDDLRELRTDLRTKNEEIFARKEPEKPKK